MERDGNREREGGGRERERHGCFVVPNVPKWTEAYEKGSLLIIFLYVRKKDPSRDLLL